MRRSVCESLEPHGAAARDPLEKNSTTSRRRWNGRLAGGDACAEPEAALARAKAALTSYAAVGVAERHADALAVLEKRLPDVFAGFVRKLPAGLFGADEVVDPAALAPATRHAILAANANDVALSARPRPFFPPFWPCARRRAAESPAASRRVPAEAPATSRRVRGDGRGRVAGAAARPR